MRVLHHDRRLVAFDKPAGLLSVPGIGPDKADCLVARAQSEFPGARIVHRLDRDTSGVIVLALDADAHRALSGQFERRETRKRYVAIAAGHAPEDAGTIDRPLRKREMGSAIQIVDPILGRPSITEYRVLERLEAPRRTRFELAPITGRSHQLRVHLASIGHPILGDELYAPAEIHAMAERLLLHAASLEITHPETGERLRFEAAYPF